MKQRSAVHRLEHTDTELRELLSKKLPETPADPWFTRKVMNRLPDSPVHRRMGMAEKLCYISGILLIISIWSYYILHTIHNGLTYNALMAAGIIPLITLFCMAIYAIPAIKRML